MRHENAPHAHLTQSSRFGVYRMLICLIARPEMNLVLRPAAAQRRVESLRSSGENSEEHMVEGEGPPFGSCFTAEAFTASISAERTDQR